jgi:acetate---CoA ligase (ADP-forming)
MSEITPFDTRSRRRVGVSRFASLTPLIQPRSVAVIGASHDPMRIGGRPIAYMKARHFAGDIFPVNPNRTEIQGLRAYASIAQLPNVPEVAIVAVPAMLAAQAVEQLGALGVKGAVVFTAGFAELGQEGAACRRGWWGRAGRTG